MKKCNLLLLGLALLLSGCVVRTYSLTRDRVDQDISGNRGYLQGSAPSQTLDKPTTRTTRVIEVELRSPIKFEKTPKQSAQQAAGSQAAITEDQEAWGNKGYISTSEALETAPTYEKYTVAKGDTLQKISKKFYGTTKKWMKIYDANKDTIKGTDKIYPGQVINIPVESEGSAVIETKSNLK